MDESTVVGERFQRPNILRLFADNPAEDWPQSIRQRVPWHGQWKAGKEVSQRDCTAYKKQ